MKAATRIRYGYAFYVPGINFVNPATREDTGTPALFASMAEVNEGDSVDAYTPLMFGPGSVFHNVTRVATDEDRAIEGNPWERREQRVGDETV